MLFMQVPCKHIGAAFALLEQRGIQRLQEQFMEDGSVELRLQVPQSSEATLQSDLLNATSGQVSLES